MRGGGGWYGDGWYHGHGGVDVWVGPGWGWWGYPYYPYPYYPYYPDYSPPQEQYEYVEPEEPAYWYFCQDPKGYYPYVKRCPKGWLKVIPTPAPKDEEDEEE